jgi:hypothetical protein
MSENPLDAKLGPTLIWVMKDLSWFEYPTKIGEIKNVHEAQQTYLQHSALTMTLDHPIKNTHQCQKTILKKYRLLRKKVLEQLDADIEAIKEAFVI